MFIVAMVGLTDLNKGANLEPEMAVVTYQPVTTSTKCKLKFCIADIDVVSCCS